MQYMSQERMWDVLVIGGGPAGMMAAGRAAERGLHVLLLEKNTTLGKKLLITGGGRCNVTNAEHNIRTLLSKFKGADKFLFSAFAQWNVQDTLDFFHTHHMPTKIEAEQRVFPVSDSAQSVWDVLVRNLKKHTVTILSKTPVTGFEVTDGIITGVKTHKKIFRARAYVLATGGTSHPETGSTGDGYVWLQNLGHTVITPTPSLVPIALKDAWAKRLAGITLQDIKLTVFQNNIKHEVQKGKLLFTHVGISGPTVLNMSQSIGSLLQYGPVTIELDLLPHYDYAQLNTTLQALFSHNHKKQCVNILSTLLPQGLIAPVLTRASIEPTATGVTITREMRIQLLHAIKHIPLHVASLLDEDKAIIASGGVILEEINFKTMQSRLHNNLYVVGDMLNIDRPSGGYSLQLCWTTGFVAGNAVCQSIQTNTAHTKRCL